MPKVVDPELKCRELAKAGFEVVAEDGLEGATLRRIATHAGCTTGQIAHYFPDRASLLLRALRDAHGQAASRMFLAAQRTSDDFGKLKAVCLEALPLDNSRLDEWRVWLAFWSYSSASQAFAREHQQRYHEWSTTLTVLAEPLCQSRVQLEREVSLLIALIDGLGITVARVPAHDPALPTLQSECAHSISLYLEAMQTRLSDANAI